MLQTKHFNISITYISFRNNSIYSLSDLFEKTTFCFSLKNTSSDFSLELQKPCLPSSKSATVRDVEGVAW